MILEVFSKKIIRLIPHDRILNLRNFFGLNIEIEILNSFFHLHSFGYSLA